MALSILAAYVLSVGPAYRLLWSGTLRQSTFNNVYAPIFFADRNPITWQVLRWYLHLWHGDIAGETDKPRAMQCPVPSPNHPSATNPALAFGCYAEGRLRRFVDRNRSTSRQYDR